MTVPAGTFDTLGLARETDAGLRRETHLAEQIGDVLSGGVALVAFSTP